MIKSPGDIAVALGASMDAGGLLLDEKQLSAEFFDLRTGLAREVLQKFTNYRARLAIVVADPSAYGSRFGELIHEHRAHAAVRFFGDAQQARRWLAYNPVVKC
jgi:PadR family transcriptional regulator AphA